MNLYLAVKTLHIVSSTLLLGTGIGTAFFLWRSRHDRRLDAKFFAARHAVMADNLFIFPAVVIQPLSGAWLVWQGGYDWTATWLVLTYVLFVFIGLCWLPVVFIQIRIKSLIAQSKASGRPLPEAYYRLSQIWFLLGWPAFGSLLVIFYLMVAKPA
jgi:uncharacterized membrane protein